MRLFIAVDLSEIVRERIALAVAELQTSSPTSKWVRPSDCHLTLVFLGDTDDDKVPAIIAALGSAASRSAPFALRVRGGSSFGDPRRPRVLWADVSGEIAALAALQREVERALVPLGHTPEGRGFTAHCTLARARSRGGDAGLAVCAEALRSYDFGETRVEEVILYRSDLSPDGVRHTALARSPLGQRA